jgi:MFS transporter, AAHS family, 4-hydroxybenzoate transporter
VTTADAQVDFDGLASFLDAQKLASWHLLVVGCCFAALFLDGMDIAAPQIAASALLKAWGSNPGYFASAVTRSGWAMNSLGLVFSAGNLGLIFGMLIFAVIGDRVGRKIGLISGVFFYSLPSCAVLWAQSPDELTVLRFVAGLGIGGVLPNVVALIAEAAPKRMRAGLILTTLASYAVGGIFAGLIGARFISQVGWTIVFIVPGFLGVALTVVIAAVMPESLRFLAVKKPNSRQLSILFARYYPTAVIPMLVRRSGESPKVAYTARDLFRGRLKYITPLACLGYFSISATFATILSWLGVLLERLGLSQAQASVTFSLTSIAAVILQLGIARVLDRLGPAVSALTAIVAGIAIIAMAEFLEVGVAAKMAIATIAVGTASVTLHLYTTTAGLLYPTGIRGRGMGWTTGLGRIGSVVGPLVIGHAIAAGMTTTDVLLLIATPLLVVIPICICLGVHYKSVFRENAQPA